MKLLALVAIGIAFLIVPKLWSRFTMSLRVSRELQAERRVRREYVRELRAYHDVQCTQQARGGESNSRSNFVDDRTWRDLDFDDVFAKIDHTLSRVGQQYLYAMLRAPHGTREPMDRLHSVALELESDAESLGRCRTALGRVDDPRAGFLVDLIFGNLPERPRFWWIFPLLTITSISCLVWTFFDSRALVAVIAMCVVNVVSQLFLRRRMETFLSAIHEIPTFIESSRSIGALQLDSCSPELATLRDGARQLSLLYGTTKWLKFEPGQESSEALTLVYSYTNLLVLGDVNAFVFGINAARHAQPLLREMYAALGYMDAVQSLIEIRRRARQWCVPEFTVQTLQADANTESASRKTLSVSGIVHPLVVDAVPNTLTIDGTSVLITGSNMSGKTTFVRALGINAILAQTINTVFGQSWHAPFLAVGASIGREDSVLEGKSYYLAEVESVRRLVRAKNDGLQHLFLLDEIFRGTNTPERVAGAYAVLEYLTHDTELREMLGADFTSRHFRENVADRQLTFDFIMRDGSATTRNAIALLELMEYPPELVATAWSVVTRSGAFDHGASAIRPG
jgi:hypothetical protein